VDLTEQEQVAHMLRRALLRRHLTDDQRAVLLAHLEKIEGPRARQEQARRAGLAGGRGRPKRPDSSRDTPSGELSGDRPEATPRTAHGQGGLTKGLPERKRRAGRELVKKAPDLAAKVEAGEMPMAQATKEMRRRGQAAPARPPRISARAAEAAGDQGPAACQASNPRAADGAEATPSWPPRSGRELAHDLVRALGRERALSYLREAVAAVEGPGADVDPAAGDPVPEPAATEMAAAAVEE
jgi:hypothetical protein